MAGPRPFLLRPPPGFVFGVSRFWSPSEGALLVCYPDWDWRAGTRAAKLRSTRAQVWRGVPFAEKVSLLPFRSYSFFSFSFTFCSVISVWFSFPVCSSVSGKLGTTGNLLWFRVFFIRLLSFPAFLLFLRRPEKKKKTSYLSPEVNREAHLWALWFSDFREFCFRKVETEETMKHP